MIEKNLQRIVWKDIFEKGEEAYQNAQSLQAEFWGIDGFQGADHYVSDFHEVLPPDFTFEKWARERKKQRLSTHIVDFFGGGYLIDTFTHVDSVTGVRLVNVDNELEMKYTFNDAEQYIQRLKKLRRQKKRQVVEGNILNIDTWTKLKKRVSQVDLMILRPKMGLNLSFKSDVEMKHECGLYFQNFKRAYTLLSHQQGMMLMQIPPTMRQEMAYLLSDLALFPGIEIQSDSHNRNLRLIKRPEAPGKISLHILSQVY